ncbi:peregrin isoform X2 [Atheta coriaria]|uniref:peregrin isoform X2 n=1 Tax=Dalotia coriaria TaxID=877792 RepID=UPI0031F409EC
MPTTPKPGTPKCTPKNKKSKSRSRTSKAHQTPAALPAVPEPLTYEEAQKMVQFEVNNQALRVNINDTLQICSRDDFPDDDSGIGVKEEKEIVPLPEASYKELEDYSVCDAPARPNAYIRFIEKSVEELDGEVEYDVDEEDTAWLSLVNTRREEAGLPTVSVDSLELLMDRLEKESYFQASVSGQTGSVVDDDAVCCICMDGECQNTNVILFCDMCNLAVHQDCYGVPYIPEGQWLCRRCLQSPSRPVDCRLCPNQGGAFKQTDKGEWAHVVCALWIPEVRFANTVFLEPIDSIETIPSARWRLVCYICKQKAGACIQCHKNNCYSAFHVTCAQSAGLYMKMDTVKDSGGESQPVLVQKIAYCDAHAPADFSDEKREDIKQKMKQARKMLAKKRGTVPVILIPTIPPDRIQEIGSLVSIQKKNQFIQRLIAYWTLKRQFRNGVPLLRRLQSAQGGTRDSNTSNVDTIELCRQLKYWQCLRQDLERARLLCELVRKREKLKLELIKSSERCWNVQFKPLTASLSNLLFLIASKDVNEIFLEPVDLEEVPDYITVVTHPMDLSTMRTKLECGEYHCIEDIEKDFELMINNCFEYNDKDTVFYRAAAKMRDQCAIIFKQAKKELESIGLADNKQEIKDEHEHEVSSVEDVPQKLVNTKNGEECSKVVVNVAPGENIANIIAAEFEAIKGKNTADVKDKLELLLTKCALIKHNLQRTRRMKQIRMEIVRVKRVLNLQESAKESQSDGEEQEPIKTPSQPSSAGTSPTGVNRRTAVLLTRKAQAAFKKPPDDKDASPDAPATNNTSLGNNAQTPVVSKAKKGKAKVTPVVTSTVTGSAVKEPNDSEKKPEKTKNDKRDVPDSFRVYRTRHKSSGEDESESDSTLSTCYSFSLSEIDTDEDSSGSNSEVNDEDDVEDVKSEVGESVDGENAAESVEKVAKETEIESESNDSKLRPLQLVWAKCRGYPWYPALIIDPEMPKGYVYRGVPLPSPPAEVMSLRENHTDTFVYLVLFFDAKRTWQWLPREKLEMLDMDKEKDAGKLNEPRKPTDRKAVKKAYQDAQHYIEQTRDDPDEEDEEENEKEV